MNMPSIVGKTLIGIRRIAYVHHGVVTDNGGPLELTFCDQTSIVFDAAGDGESLVVSSGAWIDPFAEPISQENRTFIENSGKWTAFNVQADDSFGRVLGNQILQINNINNSSEKTIGIQIQIGDMVIQVIVDSDALQVSSVDPASVAWISEAPSGD